MTDPLQSGRCLVLGARGFLGSHLVDRLLAAGVATRAFVRRTPVDAGSSGYRTHDLLETFAGDFNNEMDLLSALEGCESCVHLISTTLPGSSNQNMLYDIHTNLVGTVRLMHYAKKVGLKKMVFVSSGGAVYGDAQENLISESHPTVPKSSYGITKLASEKYLNLFRSETLSTTALRLSNPYGPRQRTTINQGAIAVFLDKALKGEEINIWGDGNVVRDYVFVEDCVEAIARSLEYRGPLPMFNVGSGSGRSLNEIVACIEELLGRKVDIRYTAARSVDPARNVLDVTLAEQHLGWTPHVAFEEGLATTAEWMQKAMPLSGPAAVEEIYPMRKQATTLAKAG